MTTTVTASDAAKHLGVGLTTLKTWAERVGVGEKTSSGLWLFTEQDMHVLGVVQMLRADDRGFDTITRRLQSELPERNGPADDTESPVPGGAGHYPAMSPDEMRGLIVDAIQGQTELAEKYARATYEIGDLRATVRHLQAQLEEKEQLLQESRCALSDGGKEVESLRLDVVRYEERVRTLEATHDPPLPWWRRLLW